MAVGTCSLQVVDLYQQTTHFIFVSRRLLLFSFFSFFFSSLSFLLSTLWSLWLLCKVPTFFAASYILRAWIFIFVRPCCWRWTGLLYLSSWRLHSSFFSYIPTHSFVVKTRGGGSSNHKPNEPNKHAEYSGGEVEAAEIYTMMSANQRSVKLFSQSVKYIALIAFLHIISSILSPILSINSIMEDGVFGRFPRFVSACPRVRVCMRTHGHFAPRQKQTPFLPLFLLLTFLSFLFFSSSSFTQANHGTVNSHTRGRQRTRDHALHVQRCAFSVRQWEQWRLDAHHTRICRFGHTLQRLSAWYGD